MKNYVSPVIFDNEELAEGVYATGSGGDGHDCWSVYPIMTQRTNTNPGWNRTIYEIHASHHKDDVEHDSVSVTYKMHISGEPATEAAAEGFEDNRVTPGGGSITLRSVDNKHDSTEYQFSLDASGTNLTVVRKAYADAFLCGDEVTFKVILWSTNGECIIDYNIWYECQKDTNCQGGSK